MHLDPPFLFVETEEIRQTPAMIRPGLANASGRLCMISTQGKALLVTY
jgi:hypothetical protein